ncbi:hypothetical protein AAGG74_18855 [Bacillus mexicanus]|uniref:hypothetical protein n=1 Tax=Bacillus mexicanus TaxID=2834415 RepID=UPI003D1C91B5
MNATIFHEKLRSSNIKTSDVLQKIFTDDRFKTEENRNKFPDAFDANGKVKLTFNSNQSFYHTYCPFHTDQTNGDSFAVYNNDQSVYCYSGCTKKPLNIIEMVMCFIFDLTPEMAKDPEFSGKYFWKSVKFLVENFGDELGIKLGELKSEGGFKRDTTQEILQATVEYYHYLGTKTNYAKKLDDYYLNTRHFRYAEVPFETLKINNKLGITPRSDEGNKLYLRLKNKGFKDEDILKANVCIKLKDGKIVDSFRNHAIVPYFFNKKVFGFYGKNFNKDAKVPHKRLKGVYETPSGLDDIQSYEEFFLVEGENTRTAVKSMGFENVMEMRGANGFKDIHVEKIKKLRDLSPDKIKKCYLVLDPDSAGRSKVMKTAKQLLEIAGVEPLVVEMPILEKNGEPWYLDVNDLYEAYEEKAKEIFLSLIEKAKSIEAFSLIYSLENETITTLSEARVALKRHSIHLNSVPKLERVFILEEVINLLAPSFENIGLNKDLLRSYLKELWLDQEVKKPVEGIDEGKKLKHTYWVITNDETTFKKYKEKIPQLLLVRDINHLEDYIQGKHLFILKDFAESDVKHLKEFTKIFFAELSEDESGKVHLEYEI